MELTTLLEQFGFTEKEAKVYIVCLELGQAPVSSIARNVGENRVTTYSILKNLVAKGIAQSFVKNRSTFYTVLTPDKVLHNREGKCEYFKEKLPEFMALADKYDNKPKVQFYEGLEGLKYVYQQLIITVEEYPEPSLVFLGTTNMDPKFQNYMMGEFMTRRAKYTATAKVIISKNSLGHEYTESNQKRLESLVIDDPIFELFDEIILYGEDKIFMAMYATDELSALIITSKTLHHALKSMFNLIWKTHKK